MQCVLATSPAEDYRKWETLHARPLILAFPSFGTNHYTPAGYCCRHSPHRQ
jgi:hypothetical protein